MNGNTENSEKNKWVVAHFPSGIRKGAKVTITVQNKNLFDKEQVNAIMECTENADGNDMLQGSGDSGC